MRKKFSKVTSLFVVTSLSLAMITGCGSDSKDDSDKKSDSDKEEEKTLTAEEIADEFSKSSVADIKVNGTSFKVVVDIAAGSGDDEQKLNAKAQLDLRSNPVTVKGTANVSGTGMDDMDLEGYFFTDDAGNSYVEVKNDDGTYSKSAVAVDEVQSLIDMVNSDEALIDADEISTIADELKTLESVGKKTVDGVDYDTLETKVSEDTISSVLQNTVPALVQAYGSQYNIDENTVDAYLSMLPTGYGEIPVDFYFDENGIPAGVGVDLGSVVKAAEASTDTDSTDENTEDSDSEDATFTVAVILSYNNTDAIAVPDAQEVDDASALVQQ